MNAIITIIPMATKSMNVSLKHQPPGTPVTWTRMALNARSRYEERMVQSYWRKLPMQLPTYLPMLALLSLLSQWSTFNK